MDRTKSVNYKSAVIALAIAAVLLLGTAGLPAIISSWLLVLAVLALPMALGYAVAAGGYALGGAVIVLCFAAGGLISYKLTLMLAAMSIPFALTVGYVLRKKLRFRHGVMAACGASLAGTGLAVGVLWLLTGMLPLDYAVNAAGSSFSLFSDAQINSMYQLFRSADVVRGAVTQAALDSTVRGDAIAYMLNIYKEYLNIELVGMLGSYALLMGLVGYLVPRAAMKRAKLETAHVPPFSEFALPDRFWLAFLASYAAALFGMGMGWRGFDILANTLFALYALVLSVQGLAFLDYIYKKRKMGRASRLALHFLAVVIGSLASMSGSLLMWIGLFENASKLRKRMETKGGTAT